MRLLDVGCGWGSLTLFAAREYGVDVTGVTLSAQQRDHVAARIDVDGLGDRARVRLDDYRDVTDGPYDAIATIEMGEHVGDAQYPAFAAGPTACSSHAAAYWYSRCPGADGARRRRVHRALHRPGHAHATGG